MKQIITLRNTVLSLSLFIAVIGLLILASQCLGIIALKSLFPEVHTMKTNMGVVIFLCGTSLAFLSRETVGKFIRFWVMFASGVIIIITMFDIFEYIFSVNNIVNKLTFNDIAHVTELSAPGLISSPTAFCFLMVGFALLMATQSTQLYLRQACIAALSTIVILISGLTLLGSLSILLLGIHVFDYTGIDVYMALVLMLLGIGLLILIHSEGGFTWSLNALMTSGFIIGILTLMGAGISSYYYTSQLRQDDESVSHSQEAINEINNIQDTIMTLENDQRLYVITGDKILLKNRLQNESLIQKNLMDFNKQITDDIYQRQHRDSLKLLIAQRNDWENKIIAVREKQGFSSAQKMILTGKGITLSNKINQLLTEMNDEEYALLDQREEIENGDFIKTFTLLPLGMFLSLTMLTLGLFIFNAGIDERKKLGASGIQLSAIVNSSNDAIIGKDLNGTIISWNKAAEQMFGYTAKEIIGQSMLSLIPEDRRKEEEKILNKIRHGEKIEHFETIRKRKDGKLLNVSATISPIKNADNKIIGASKIVRDITEKRQLEQQLRQSQKMEAIGQLTGGVAHDFNNLLGIILGNLDLLERLVADNEEAKKRVNTALKAATRGAELTKRLLTFSRLQQLNPAPTSLEESIKNTVELAARTLGPEIKIITQLDKSVPTVFVDAAGLESVLLNLAVNSRDAMPNGGTLTIATELKNIDNSYPPAQTGDIKPNAYACISVTDTGCGMSRETMDRAFDPFFTTKQRGKGTGLGLSMVYGFIKQSGGIVRLYSELNHGTTVVFYLPLAQAVPVPIDLVIERDHPKVSGTVLVVDDEIDLLEIAVIYLKEMGYNVLRAIDAKSALAIAESEPHIDLLVTDIIMPGGMNGVELAEELHKQKPNVVIVYTSGFPSGALTERSGTKIDGPLINKPYQRVDFVTTIRLAMNHSAKSGNHSVS